MAHYIFSAERQLIFYVTVDGRTRLVQFGERSQWGASNFSTDDAKVAAAIRRHSMFLRGVITETTPPQQEPPKQVKKAATKPVGEQAGTVAGQSPAADDDEGQGTDETGQDGAGDDTANVIEADNFTQAKEAVMKRLGVDKDAVKTPILLQKVAKDNGLTINYKKK